MGRGRRRRRERRAGGGGGRGGVEQHADLGVGVSEGGEV